MAYRPSRRHLDEIAAARGLGRRTFPMATDHGSNPRLVGVGQPQETVLVTAQKRSRFTTAKGRSRFTRKGRGPTTLRPTAPMPFSMSCCWDCKGCCKELPWNPYLDQDECVELCKGVCQQIGIRP